MKNLTKSLLATLMLIGLFSTNVFAAVDCTGFKVKYNPETIVWHGSYPSGEYKRCKMFNESGATWLYTDERSGEIRYQNQKWDGVRRYKGADNSSANSIQAPVQKVEVVAKKTKGQKASENFGLYVAIINFGYGDGIDKIYAFCKSLECTDKTWMSVRNHIESLSMKQIRVLAKKKANSSSFAEFIEEINNKHALLDKN
jgi:hypothetical protein